jgi:glutamate-1-semialdehyde 2,1-aminomutase
VTEAVTEQAGRGTHYGANHELEVAWAEAIVGLVPSAEMVRFTSSGTEATLMALRLARAATGRPAVLKFERHFHGWHDYVVPASTYQAAAPPGIPAATLDSVVVAPVEMAAVREILAGRDDIGTVIVEASGAGSGQVPLPRGFLQELRELTAARGLVMVMDEVVTGFRWSPGGVQEVEGVTPDLTTLAKIMAGGLPGGAVCGRRDLLDHLQFPPTGSGAEKVAHPGTFNANPLSAAAGVACLSEMPDGAHQARANAMAARLRTGINGSLSSMGIGGCAYGQVSEFKVVLAQGFDPGSRDWDPRDLPAGIPGKAAPGDAGRLFTMALINHGVHTWAGPSGFCSSAHSEADIDDAVAAFGAALRELQAEGAI